MNPPLPENSRPEKALWYQEVLSLDPASRIFLPYARLLVEHGRRTEALDILRAGLARHPEFLEARLFFIDLLHASGEENAAALEAAPLIEALSQCPSLWKVWSRSPGVRPDQASLLLFFGTTFKEGGPSMADVFRAGLSALGMDVSAQDAPKEHAEKNALPAREKEETPPLPADAAPAPHVTEVNAPAPHVTEENAPVPPAPAAPCFVMSEDTPWYSLDSVPDDDDVFDEESDGTAAPAPALSPAIQELFFPEPPAEEARKDGLGDPAAHAVPRSSLEGKSSLCTRSMARILEEQGAMVEAADIYRELLESSASPEERAELNAKLDSLRQSTENPVAAEPASSGILDMLETLAVRLENKSRA